MELLLLSQFNMESPLPTMFEIIAVSRMESSLYDVLKFVGTSLASSYPERLARLMPYFDEFYVVIDALLQRAFVIHADSSMAENTFSMRRSGVVPVGALPLSTGASPSNGGSSPSTTAVGGAITDGALSGVAGGTADPLPQTASAASTSSAPSSAPSGARGAASGIVRSKGVGVEGVPALDGLRLTTPTHRQRVIGWAVVVIVGYLRRRLVDYARWLKSDSPDERAERTRQEAAARGRWLAIFNRVVELVVPWANFAAECADIAFMIAYLADRTPHATAALWAQGLVLRRANRDDVIAVSGNPTVQRATKVAQVLLMSLAIGFRIFDWWRTADGRAASSTVIRESLPAPDAPRAPAAAADVTLPADGHCPVCRRPFTNACVNAASGYVFCYPCLHQAVAANGLCPATKVPTTLGQIRRLYESG